MRRAIIIVNFRTPDLVCNCLHSLSTEVNVFDDQVIVVDNNSGDGSVERLSATIEERSWKQWITILPQERNLGFAAGNNAAIWHLLSLKSNPDYVLLLNPDTVVHAKAVDCLTCFLDEHLGVGIVGAQLENEDHVPQSSARRYPSVWSELENGARLWVLSRLLRNFRVALPATDQTHRCDWVSGAAMLIRRQVFEDIGLMDEGFFLYFEELDFCQRANNSGWQIWLESAALVTHLEGRATSIHQARKRRGQYWYNSRRRYFIKHHGILRWILGDLLWGIGRLSLLVRTFFKLGGDTSNDPLYYFRDLIWGDLFALMNGDAWRIKEDCGTFVNWQNFKMKMKSSFFKEQR